MPRYGGMEINIILLGWVGRSQLNGLGGCHDSVEESEVISEWVSDRGCLGWVGDDDNDVGRCL